MPDDIVIDSRMHFARLENQGRFAPKGILLHSYSGGCNIIAGRSFMGLAEYIERVPEGILADTALVRGMPEQADMVEAGLPRFDTKPMSWFWINNCLYAAGLKPERDYVRIDDNIALSRKLVESLDLAA